MFGDTPTDNHFDETIINQNQTDFNEDCDSNFTEKELHKVIFSLKSNKSPGMDSITTEILKSSYNYTSQFLLTLYNRMFTSGEYPRAWGEGIISPIFKKGDANEACNYRGITLISILAKVYSQLLLNRLTGWSEKCKKYQITNLAFRKGNQLMIAFSFYIRLFRKY